ncbi:MAG TPA: trehalose-phosphatase [Mycobacteriales bacterium]|nr:trehalose-phosphatase [Mycobacteriales bacterium]
MPTSRTAEGSDALAAIAKDPAAALIALDFDGTLAPIVPDPATSRMAEGGHAALVALAEAGARIVIVTGRSAAVVVELGRLADIPGIVVEGQYGAERWEAGELHKPEPVPGIAAVRAALPSVLAEADPGTWVEDKELSLVVHTRRAADPAGELERFAPALIELANTHGLEAGRGRNVVELRPPGIDKGGALRRVVDQIRPEVVLFGGDDVGDLPAFEFVAELRRDGRPGVTVCSASAEAPQIAELADVVVDGPAGIVALLESLLPC